jgi:hypothetical protein
MYEFLVGIPPFNDDTRELIYNNILNLKMQWPTIGKLGKKILEIS